MWEDKGAGESKGNWADSGVVVPVPEIRRPGREWERENIKLGPCYTGGAYVTLKWKCPEVPRPRVQKEDIYEGIRNILM